ncbi:MAG: 6-bladed beta-propeller [Gemmatimonadota bacterium]
MLEGIDMSLAIDRTDRIFVSEEPRRAEVKVYDGEGRYLRTLGQEGEGPGEYQSIAGLHVGPSDSLFVFDGGLWRMTVYGPDLGEPVRTTRLPIEPQYRVLVLEDGRLVSSSAMGTPELIGLPIHVMSADGNLLRSFGHEGARTPADAGGGARLIAPTPDRDALWAVQPGGAYRLEKWTPEGDLVTEIRGNEDLLDDPGLEAEGFRVPRPMITAIAEDPGGWLWVAIRSSKPNWTDYLVRRDNHVTLEPGSRQTTIQALDPASGQVLASVTVPHELSGFPRPGLMFETRLSESLEPVARLFELRLQPK